MVWPAWVLAGAETVVGGGFALGILLMNFPQHYECWKHRSAEGISLGYILICSISNVTLWLATLLGDYNVIIEAASGANINNGTDFDDMITNATTLMDWNTTVSASSRILEEPLPPLGPDGQQNWDVLLLRLFETLNACMPTFQNFLCVLVGVPSYIFYYFYFETPQIRAAQLLADLEPSHRRAASQEPLLRLETDSEEEQELVSINTNINAPQPPSARLYYSDGTEQGRAKIFTVLTWIICLICTLIGAGVLFHNNRHWEANLLEIFGSIAAVTNMMLFIPQIITTHRNQHEGVLSLSSLMICVAGDMAQGVYWTMGAGESVWVLSALVADAGMQCILIWMIVDFRKKRFRQAQQQEQVMYEYVHDSSDMEDSQCDYDPDSHNLANKGEIEVVFGDLFEIYSETASVVERLLESASTSNQSSTMPESLEDSSTEFVI